MPSLSVCDHCIFACIAFSTKKALWQTLAEMISRDLESPCSPLQVQNKLKSLERAYKRTK